MVRDLVVIGGGVNGAAVARDAAGRGLAVTLLEAGDLGGATSSASTKLVHGGLRYLEFGEVGLVRKALVERERLLRAAPHIAWPLPFVLPVVPWGRPAWLLACGLLLYDRLARRREVPAASRIDLGFHAAGGAFRPGIGLAFRFFDGWVDDARLVVLLARDARERGAEIRVRDAAARARFADGLWQVTTASGHEVAARHLVNAAGPWAETVARNLLDLADAPRLRLVQGAHLVTRRVNRTGEAFLLQQPDGRVVFVLPYERDWSLVGTTETAVEEPDAPAPTAEEEAYLLAAANRVLARPLGPDDVRHRFAGIRPLVLEEGKGLRETTRDWRFHAHAGVPATTIVGGKITTFRRLAEELVSRLFPSTRPWTADAVLPGGAIPDLGGRTARANFLLWVRDLERRFPDHDPQLVARLAGLYGTEAEALLTRGLGGRLPSGLFEAEAAHLSANEFARTEEDMLWRRTKLALAGDRNPAPGRAPVP